MKRVIKAGLFVLIAASLHAQTGPAGVGNSSSNILWLRADQITGLSDGGALTTWPDVSGNDDSPTQSTAGNKPLYKTTSSSFNSKPYVRFDGSNDYLNLTGILSHSASDYTIVAVYRTTSTSRQTVFDAQSGRVKIVHEGSTQDKAYTDGTARGTEITGTGAKVVMWILDNAGSSIVEAGTVTQSGLGYTNRAIGGTIRVGGPYTGGDYFNGDIAELIIYDYAINTAQMHILENSLANKYNISTTYDQYAYSTVNDIAGIGRINGSNINATAMSAGILQIGNATGMGDNEGLLFGHDAGSISSWSTSETPNSYIRRLAREWRLDETGEVNGVTFTIDTALLPARPSGFSGYVLMLDTDGNFSSGATYYSLTSAGGSTYSVSGVNTADGEYVAIGVAQNVSTGSGNFSTAGTWMFNAVPSSTDEVMILNEHTVTLNANVSVKSVTINNGGTLNLGSYTLTLSSTLVNGGTFTPSTGTVLLSSAGSQTIPALTYNNLSLDGAGTKSLAGNAVVNGALTISAGTLDATASNYGIEVKGNWNNTGGTFNARSGTVTLSGSSAQQIAPNGSSFHNLTLSGAGTKSLAANTVVTGTLTLGAGSLDVTASNYSLTVGGNWNNPGGTFNARSGTVTLNGASAQLITAGASGFHHLDMSGAGTKSLAGSIAVNGNLTLSAGTLDVTASNYSLTVRGNWINTGGTFTARQGTVVLSGTANQQITSNGGSFYNLLIANTATQVSLNDDASLSNVLTLSDGVLTTGSSKVILSSSSASAITGYSSASFVNGNLRRYFANNNDTYVFPLGNGTASTSYYRADIINKNLDGITYFDSKFKPLANHCDCDLNAADYWEHGSLTYTSVNAAGVWELEPNQQPNSGKYDIKLYIANMSGLEDNSFGLLKRPANSLSAADWTVGAGKLANDDAEGRRVADGYMLRTNLGTFSEFGAGHGSSAGAGLPIELMSFTAVADDQEVQLNWATATEVDNDYFIIERSTDGEGFETVAIIPGAGNSSETKHYATVDTRPYTGISYYRLTQVDFDGVSTVSNIVAVIVAHPVTEFVLSPNPFRGKELTIQISGAISKTQTAQLQISAMNGQEVINLPVKTNGSKIVADLEDQLPQGVYFVRLLHNGTAFFGKLVVN